MEAKRDLGAVDGVDDGLDDFAGPPRGSIEDRLRRIARLRDMGALTSHEYEKAKAKLLSA